MRSKGCFQENVGTRSTSWRSVLFLQEVTEELSIIERTAQRIISALKDFFPSISHQIDGERRRWWKLIGNSMLGIQGLYRRKFIARYVGHSDRPYRHHAFRYARIRFVRFKTGGANLIPGIYTPVENG
jgi:hypothetical protein